MSERGFDLIAAKIGIAKIRGVDFDLLNDGTRIIQNLREISDLMSWRRRDQELVDKFEPHGITGAIVLGASLIGVHTWPEYGMARFNVELCSESDTANFNNFPELLKDKFKAEEVKFEEIDDQGSIRIVRHRVLTDRPTTPLRQLTLRPEY